MIKPRLQPTPEHTTCGQVSDLPAGYFQEQVVTPPARILSRENFFQGEYAQSVLGSVSKPGLIALTRVDRFGVRSGGPILVLCSATVKQQ